MHNIKLFQWDQKRRHEAIPLQGGEARRTATPAADGGAFLYRKNSEQKIITPRPYCEAGAHFFAIHGALTVLVVTVRLSVTPSMVAKTVTSA